MEKKQKEKYLKELKRIEGKRSECTNEMVLLDKISKQLSLLIRIILDTKN